MGTKKHTEIDTGIVLKVTKVKLQEIPPMSWQDPIPHCFCFVITTPCGPRTLPNSAVSSFLGSEPSGASQEGGLWGYLLDWVHQLVAISAFNL